MERSRLKSITIIILLVVDISLFALYLFGAYDSSRRRRDEIHGLAVFFDQSGIILESDAVSKSRQATCFTLSRDKAKEAEAASKLLGSVSAEDYGGNIVRYQSELGSAVFGDSGFEIILDDYGDSQKSVRDLSAALFRQMGLFINFDSPSVTVSEETRSASYPCLFSGGEIFNFRVNVSFNDGAVITGYRLIGEVRDRTRTGSFMSAGSALTHFLNEIRLTGIVCSRIIETEAGYLVSVSGADCLLDPVWRIVTDGGTFYIDGYTGKLVTP